MKETVFQAEIIKTFYNYGGWAYKIPDAPFLPSHIESFVRFTPEKPCDLIAMYRMIPLAIECKQMKKYESLGERHFETGQIKHLNKITDLKAGRAYVFLNVRIVQRPRVNKLIIIPWEVLRKKFGYSSLRAEQIRRLPFFESKKGIYNIESWLKNLQK